MKLKMMDPQEILAVIVLLIVLGIGVYAVFITTNALVTTTPRMVGNNEVMSGNRSIHSVTATPLTGNSLTWLNCTGIVNETAGIELQGWNTTTQLWTVVQAVGAANGTVESTNSTYRVSIRSVYGTAGSPNWHFLRCKYSVNNSATSTITNQTQKSLKNQSVLGGTVFNIIGIVITISAIISIITVIYAYLGPKK